MKINSILYTLATLAAFSLLSGCQSDTENPAETGETTLSFSPTVEGMSQEGVTRAAGAFFNAGDQITVKSLTSRPGATEATNAYTYNTSGIFTGSIRFRLDNTYIKHITALWPTEAVRAQSIITDQRALEDYRKADRLKAEANTDNIMPTAEPIPLNFKHEQSRLTFRLAGQNANGLIIKELIVELKANVNGRGPEAAAFWAYCKDNGNAELILPPGVELKGVTEPLMIGLVTVGSKGNSNKDYRGGIYIPATTDITLEASTDYLVTLTPQGYNMSAHITIETFFPGEGYIGIPIQMPEKVSEGNYKINTVTQLVTLSRLLAGGYIKGEDAAIWKSYQYVIDDNLAMSANGKLYFLPIDAALKAQFNKEEIPDALAPETNFALFNN